MTPLPPSEDVKLCRCGKSMSAVCEAYPSCRIPLHDQILGKWGRHDHHAFSECPTCGGTRLIRVAHPVDNRGVPGTPDIVIDTHDCPDCKPALLNDGGEDEGCPACGESCVHPYHARALRESADEEMAHWHNFEPREGVTVFTCYECGTSTINGNAHVLMGGVRDQQRLEAAASSTLALREALEETATFIEGQRVTRMASAGYGGMEAPREFGGCGCYILNGGSHGVYVSHRADCIVLRLRVLAASPQREA